MGFRKINCWNDLVNFFESKLDKTSNPNGCWIYTGNLDCYGYGRINAKGIGITIKTHRLSWIINRGPLTSEEFMCHRCDNPPCCNPDHLFIGDNSSNFKDMWRKNRGHICRGETHPTAKLSDGNVIAIKQFWKTGEFTQQSLGDKFGVSQAMISNIVHGKSWTHLD